MTREYRNFTREEKIKAVKMVLNDKKSQMEVERRILGKKKCTVQLTDGLESIFRKAKKIVLKRKGV